MRPPDRPAGRRSGIPTTAARTRSSTPGAPVGSVGSGSGAVEDSVLGTRMPSAVGDGPLTEVPGPPIITAATMIAAALTPVTVAASAGSDRRRRAQ